MHCPPGASVSLPFKLIFFVAGNGGSNGGAEALGQSYGG